MYLSKIASRIAEVVDAQENFWRSSINRAFLDYPEDHIQVPDHFLHPIGLIHDFACLENIVQATRHIVNLIIVSDHTSEDCCRKTFNEVCKIAEKLNGQIDRSDISKKDVFFIPIVDMEHAYDDAIDDAASSKDPENVIRFPNSPSPSEPNASPSKYGEFEPIIEKQRALAEATGMELFGMYDKREDMFTPEMMEQWKSGVMSNKDIQKEIYKITDTLDQFWKGWYEALDHMLDEQNSNEPVGDFTFEIPTDLVDRDTANCSDQVKRLIDRYTFMSRQNLMKMNKIFNSFKSHLSEGNLG